MIQLIKLIVILIVVTSSDEQEQAINLALNKEEINDDQNEPNDIPKDEQTTTTMKKDII